MAVFIISSFWLSGMVACWGVAIAEVIHMGYLFVRGNEVNVIGFGFEILVFVVAGAYCYTKRAKEKEEAERAGPLYTEEQKQQMKKEKATKKREPIKICKPAAPYLYAAIFLYVVFLVLAVFVFLAFSWWILLSVFCVAGISGWCVWKYMKVKDRIYFEAEKERELQRKKKAARAAALRRQQESEKQQNKKTDSSDK